MIKNRFSEPSTWAGIAAIAQMSANFLPTNWAWVCHAITAAAGSAAVSLREGKND